MAKTIEIIKLDEIIPVTSKTDFQGGIINHGDFLEGYCFQIHTKTKENKDIVWELCANTKVKSFIKKFVCELITFIFN